MRTLLAALIVTAGFASPAAGQDIDAMARWTAATVIRYRVVGEYAGVQNGLAEVTDRLEFEFDWDQTEMKIVGKPVIRNFPTKVGKVGAGPGCGPYKIEGPLEFATVTAVEVHPTMGMSGVLVLKSTQDEPASATCSIGDSGVPVWTTWKAKTVSHDIGFMVGQPVMLGLPGQSTPDGKSLIVKGDGWTWTQTPTIVK
jgi:hypothetical protein